MNWKSSGAMFQSMVLANSVANKKFSGRIILIWNIRVKCRGLTIKYVYVVRIQEFIFHSNLMVMIIFQDVILS